MIPDPNNEEGRPGEKAASTSSPDGKLKSTLTQPWEPSAWFRGQLARLEAKAATALALRAAEGEEFEMVVMALHHSTPGSREDRTCDRCREYVPPTSAKFAAGAYRFRVAGMTPGVMTFGLCDRCRRLEGLPEGRVTL